MLDKSYLVYIYIYTTTQILVLLSLTYVLRYQTYKTRQSRRDNFEIELEKVRGVFDEKSCKNMRKIYYVSFLTIVCCHICVFILLYLNTD